MPVARLNGQGDGNAGGMGDWLNGLPIVTRYWLLSAAVITGFANFGLGINPYQVLFNWTLIKDQMQIWRILTPFCYAGGRDIQTLFTLYMLYSMSSGYERGGPYNTGAGGGTADYVFCLLFGATAVLLTYPLLSDYLMPAFVGNMVSYIMYIWSKKFHTANASIWGVPVPALYFPFVYLMISMFIGKYYFDQVHGFAIGHLYFFLVDVYPRVYGRDILQTPKVLIDQFGIGVYRPQAPPRPAGAAAGGFGNAAAARAPAAGGGGATGRGGGHDWGGGGQRLGRQ